MKKFIICWNHWNYVAKQINKQKPFIV